LIREDHALDPVSFVASDVELLAGATYQVLFREPKKAVLAA
jgi:hypothetical protein